MPRKGRRLTIAKGIYRDGPNGPYEIRVVVGGQPYTSRLPADSTLDELKTERAKLESKGRTETPRAVHGTLRAAVPAYLTLMKHLASWDDREDHLNAWVALIGDLPRHRITSADVLRARIRWLKEGLSPKTINHRVGTLRHLYHRLDGKRAPTPCDEVDPLPVPKTPIQRVSETLMLKVDRELQRREAAKILPDAKTRARYRVLITTGRRHSEVMRAQPADVDLERRVWVVRDAKGGWSPGLYLNDDMLAAWRLFVEANAWGPFSHASFTDSLRSAGWPKDIRVYAARHATWIAASERGADLADIAVGAGHTDIRTTRKAYVPVLRSRMQQLGERLDGRFGGFSVGPTRGTGQKRRVLLRKSRRPK